MAREVRVVESFEVLPDHLKKRVVKELAKGRVKLPLLLSDGDVIARLDFSEIVKAVKLYWRDILHDMKILITRDPEITSDMELANQYSLGIAMPCGCSIGIDVLDRELPGNDDEAVIRVLVKC